MRGIYAIRNKVNGKKYIGRSTDVEGRWSNHKRELKRDDHKNDHLQNAWKKYGEENFTFELIEEVNKEDLRKREQEFLDNYRLTRNWDRLYNTNKSAEGAMSGRNHPRYGTCHSKTAIKKIREANLGKTHSEEAKENMRQAQLGRTHPEEVKKKISEAQKGKELSKETKRKMKESADHKGEKNSKSKLNKGQVKEIRRRYEKGDITQEELAKEYPVSRSGINAILNRHSWNHI